MDPQTLQSVDTTLRQVAARQHHVIRRTQLLALGFGPDAVKHRVATGLLHPIHRGVYAVGRPHLSREGQWMAALLTCGPHAVLSHWTAAELWELRPSRRHGIELSVPLKVSRRRPGIVVHRRGGLTSRDLTARFGLAVTTPVCTLIDIAPRLTRDELEAAVNAADRHGVVDPETLRRKLEQYAGRPGVAPLRRALDRRTFTLTDSGLERLFLPIARAAGLPTPLTRQELNGFRVDFFWPDLGLVVETDGLRYHRTPAQQARDRLRDQAHSAAGLTPLRFTRAQVRYEPDHVLTILRAVAQRLAAAP